MSDIQIRLIIKDDGTAVLEKVGQAHSKLERQIKDGSTATTGMIATLKENWIGITAAVYGAEKAVETFWGMAKRGAAFEETQQRLNDQLRVYGMTADQIVAKLQQVTAGQLSLAEASQVASRALATGMNPEQVSTIAAMAEILGDIKNIPLAEAFENITRAIITGRSESIKSLGVFIDLDEEVAKVAKQYGLATSQIDETTKVQIRLNAVMGQAPAVLKKYGEAGSSVNDRLEAMEKRFDNLTLAASRFAKSIVVGIADAIAAMDKWQIASDSWVARVRANQERVAAANARERAGAFIGPVLPPGFVAPPPTVPPAAAAPAGGLSPEAMTSLRRKQAEEDAKFIAETRRLAGEQIAHDIAGWGKAEEAYGKYTADKLSEDYKFNEETKRLAGEQIAHDIEGWGKAQEAYGRYLVDKWTAEREAGLRQRTFWTSQAEDFIKSNVFSLSAITQNFNSAFASWIVMGTSFKGFWQQTQMTLLSASLQFIEQLLVRAALAEAAKTSLAAEGAAARVGIASAEAGTTISIFGAMATAVYGMFAAVFSATISFMSAAWAALVAIGQQVVGLLTAIASAMEATVFGIPVGLAIGAAAAALAGYLASQGEVMAAVMVGVGAVLAGAAGLGAFSGTETAPGAGVSGVTTWVQHGGIVTRPTILGAGEAGPEAIIPLDRLRDFGGNQTISIYLDSALLARKIVREMPKEVRMLGVPL